MFERISRSFELAKASWNVLYTDKQLVLFPILSGLASLLVLISFIAPLVGLTLNGTIVWTEENGQLQPPWWFYVVVFAFYFCSYFVIIFFNAALVSCAILRFNGQTPTLGDGLRAAFARLPQILAWALVSATIGMILKMIENAHEKAGEIISAILGTAWTILTYFVVPILVVEKLGPVAAVSRSTALLRKTWGEALAGHIGLGLFQFLIVLPGILLLIGGGVACASLNPVAIGLSIVGLGLLYCLLAFAVCAALDTIFLSALYQFAAFDKVPEGFDRGTIEGAFSKKQG
jgi:hypothetical protein